ncbi:hypothetical protein [Cardiobacterium hominis]|uniref:hypothetical protein n=1 Tax=Cardiobacterium hominis TaxID=2718 RepID=UPI0028D3EE5B|nr:hypothetical protein [Cardiobacterium hominis]
MKKATTTTVGLNGCGIARVRLAAVARLHGQTAGQNPQTSPPQAAGESAAREEAA